MNPILQQRLMDFLSQQFSPDGSIYFLAVSVIKLDPEVASPITTFQVRVALTFQDSSGVNPYFDGTDLFVTITPKDICFTQEEDWAEGPPICEGSPIELALGWVSELAPPFFVSLHAKDAAAKRAVTTADQPKPYPTDPNPWL